jgi:hypothetical protein
MSDKMTHSEKLLRAGVRRHGSEEAWRESRASDGRKGGYTVTEKTKLRGFGGNRDLAVQGGRISRPRKSS